MSLILTADGRPLTPAQEQESWPFKALVALKDDPIARDIMVCLIGRTPKDGKRRITSTATVDKAGLVWCNVSYGLNAPAKTVCLGEITDIRDEFRRLADHLKLEDAERLELFNELRMWVSYDMRADHDELKTTH